MSASSAGSRPALMRGLHIYVGVEHDTPLLLRESIGETIGDSAAEDGCEERLKEADAEFGVLSSDEGGKDDDNDKVLCSVDMLESIPEDTIFSFAIAFGLKG